MKIKGSDTFYFFKNHEAKQNKSFIKLIAWCLIIFPLLLLAEKLEFLPDIGNVFLLSLFGVLSLSILFSYLVLKYDPYASFIKYLLILTEGILLFMMSINQNTEVFISFCLIPIISCLYLNKRFTLNISIIFYITMLLSLGIRAITKNFFYEANFTRIQWFIRYAVGMTIEYLICCLSISFLCRNNHYLVESDYDQTAEQVSGQTIIISSFMELLNKHSGINHQHPKRCSKYATVICRNLRKRNHYSTIITEDDIPYITTAALVHDIGLIIIPQRILNKSTPLTELEIQELKLHTIQGEEIFRQNMQHIDTKYLNMFCDVILYHHEQWNGQGYPHQLAENAIPLSARIVFAANLLDNLTHNRPTQDALTFDAAIEIIRRMGGREIDPVIAQVVYESREELHALYDKMD